MKLTELQHHKISQAYENANSVLQQIKHKPLKGVKLEQMKVLEDAVSHLECFIASSS